MGGGGGVGGGLRKRLKRIDRSVLISVVSVLRRMDVGGVGKLGRGGGGTRKLGAAMGAA